MKLELEVNIDEESLQQGTRGWLLANSAAIRICLTSDKNLSAWLLDRNYESITLLCMQNGWSGDRSGDPSGPIRLVEAKQLVGKHSPRMREDIGFTAAAFKIVYKIAELAAAEMLRHNDEHPDNNEVVSIELKRVSNSQARAMADAARKDYSLLTHLDGQNSGRVR